MATGGRLDSPGFAAIATGVLEVGHPLELRSPRALSLEDYGRVRALVRLHGQPLGFVDLDLGAGCDRKALAAQVWAALRREIDEHLLADRLPRARTLAATGLPGPARPLCRERRALLLADAPFASVVVATHERPESLGVCLQALEALEYPAYEVVVVDNAPLTDGTARVVA